MSERQYTYKYFMDNVDPEKIIKLREIIANILVQDKRRPTINIVRDKIQELQLDLNLSDTNFYILLKALGYKWLHTLEGNRVLMEKNRIRNHRVKYLEKIEKYRAEGRSIIYLVESDIYLNETLLYGQYKWENEGQRLAIMHAGGETGFIPNALQILKSEAMFRHNYFNDISHVNFIHWVSDQLLPNLPQHSVIVINNAPYHNSKVKTDVDSNSKESDIMNWLTERYIPFRSDLSKPELLELVKDYNKQTFNQKVFKFDELVNKKGHSVLRLPRYHPELNPTQQMWVSIKHNVIESNTSRNLEDLERVCSEKFESVTAAEWKSIWEDIKTTEGLLMEREFEMDEAFDNLDCTDNSSTNDDFGALSDNDSDSDECNSD